MEGLRFKECTKLLGPIVEGTVVPNGTRVPGTSYQLDPVSGAFNIGAMIRWLDYNDCWLAAEWGHPSDNLGAILAVADWVSRSNRNGVKVGNGKILKVKDVLDGIAMTMKFITKRRSPSATARSRSPSARAAACSPRKKK